MTRRYGLMGILSGWLIWLVTLIIFGPLSMEWAVGTLIAAGVAVAGILIEKAYL